MQRRIVIIYRGLITKEVIAMKILTDTDILDLLNARDQSGLTALSDKYGALCQKMCMQILGSREDAEECLNDALLKIWESIPPNRPESLSGYLVTVCRRIAIDRRRGALREKRGGGMPELPLDELSACLASPDSPEDVFDGRALTDAVNRFLDTLPAETRVMFILRYWYCLPVSEIAAEVGGGASRVKMTLMRTRKKLRACLEQEGYL